jgi:hypothetical protein
MGWRHRLYRSRGLQAPSCLNHVFRRGGPKTPRRRPSERSSLRHLSRAFFKPLKAERRGDFSFSSPRVEISPGYICALSHQAAGLHCWNQLTRCSSVSSRLKNSHSMLLRCFKHTRFSTSNNRGYSLAVIARSVAVRCWQPSHRGRRSRWPLYSPPVWR